MMQMVCVCVCAVKSKRKSKHVRISYFVAHFVPYCIRICFISFEFIGCFVVFFRFQYISKSNEKSNPEIVSLTS